MGNLRLTYDGQSIAGLQTDRYQSLVAYLVLEAQNPQPRSRLATLFWSDIAETQAKANLRRELYRLRQILPEADRFLCTTAQTVQWQPQLPWWLDVAEFEAAIAHAVQQTDLHRKIEALEQAIDISNNL